MPTLLPIDEIIEIGDISGPLSALYTTKQSLFGGSVIKPKPPIQITIVTDMLRWAYEGGAETAANQRLVANYLFWMCGQFQLEAQNIINGSGGGSVIPTPSGGSALNPYDWVVAVDSFPLAAGETSVVLDGTGGTQDFRGFNLEFYRGGQPQYTTLPPDGVSFYYLWNRTTGTLTLRNGAAQLGEQMRIVPIADVEDAPSTSGQTIDSDWWETTEGESTISGLSQGGLSFAGKRVIMVVRGVPLNIVTTGAPTGPQALYDLGEEISVDATNPFGPGETVTVVWVETS